MKTEEYNKGVSFQVNAIGFKALCRAIGNMPGVIFTRRRRFFWSGADVGAEFTFRGETFTISTDEWDGALWVMTKDGQHRHEEMQELRDTVEKYGAERGLIGTLWHRFITETFT